MLISTFSWNKCIEVYSIVIDALLASSFMEDLNASYFLVDMNSGLSDTFLPFNSCHARFEIANELSSPVFSLSPCLFIRLEL